jgi:hypothetical protein
MDRRLREERALIKTLEGVVRKINNKIGQEAKEREAIREEVVRQNKQINNLRESVFRARDEVEVFYSKA